MTLEGLDGDATIKAVNYAVKLWAFQMGYPDVGDWEMIELAHWRTWLSGWLQAEP